MHISGMCDRVPHRTYLDPYHLYVPVYLYPPSWPGGSRVYTSIRRLVPPFYVMYRINARLVRHLCKVILNDGLTIISEALYIYVRSRLSCPHWV
jgi:hypothetical protein